MKNDLEELRQMADEEIRRIRDELIASNQRLERLNGWLAHATGVVGMLSIVMALTPPHSWWDFVTGLIGGWCLANAIRHFRQ